ncbi:MAG: response regulator [Chiayiivirga sp.]|jgi:PleD family two-component response regulator|nr:response regulator [Chiayiivirga sp.]
MVLMDLYMPECDGTEFTALIRERDEFLNTPIVFLSGESDQDKHYEALSVGGDDFLSKPIRPKYLIASVTNRVQRARALRQRSRRAAAARSGHRPAPPGLAAGSPQRSPRPRQRQHRWRAVPGNRRRGGIA